MSSHCTLLPVEDAMLISTLSNGKLQGVRPMQERTFKKVDGMEQIGDAADKRPGGKKSFPSCGDSCIKF